MHLPVVVLRSGTRVANLFETQPIVLDTGEVLPPCVSAPNWRMCLREITYDYHPWQDVELKPFLSLDVKQMFFHLDWEEIDIVLVPTYVRQAVVEEYKRYTPSVPFWLDAAYKKVRSILVSDKETGVVFSNKFLM